MNDSDDSAIKAIMTDDVSALSVWSWDHRDFEVALHGRNESVLTLACVANAKNCIASMLLRGVVPDERTIAAAVRGGDPALIRKIGDAANPSTILFRAFQTALWLEKENVAAFFARKQPELTAWHEGIMRKLPQDSLAMAIAIFNRAVLDTEEEVLLVYQREAGESIGEKLAPGALIRQSLGPRKPETILRIRAVCDIERWTRHEPWAGDPWDAPGLWPEVDLVDLSEIVVNSIGNSSFANSDKLTSVWLPDAATEIQNCAFSGCRCLQVVKVGKGMKTIGEHAFFVCEKLVEIVLPDSVAEIGAGAFSDCSSLKVVKVGGGLRTLGKRAFFLCQSLFEIALPDSVREIGEEAFCNCSSLKFVDLGNELKSLREGAFYECGSLIEIVLPDTTIEVCDGSFCHCDSLKAVKVGNGLRSIGRNAFSHCGSLLDIVLPDSVIEVGKSAFANCTSLEVVHAGNGLKSVGARAFYKCERLIEAILGGTGTIGKFAFGCCVSLNEIVLPDTVTEIGERAFYNCTLLKMVKVGSGLKTLGEKAFEGCESLVDIPLPDSVTSVGMGA
jgi:hypothetical protein